MASNPKLLASLRNTMMDAITTALGNAALIEIYDGSQPAGPATAISTQNKLGTLTGASPFAPGASGGVLTAGTITQDTAADATGTATWARLKTSGGTAIIDLSVGASGCDINLNTASIVLGGPIQMSSLTITAPGG